MIKFYKDKDWLYDQYITKKRSTVSIGRKCSVDKSVILYWLKKFNIPRRENKGIYDYKISEETRRKISEANKGSKNGMFGKKHSIETKKLMSKNRGSMVGDRNPNYKGGHLIEKFCLLCGKKFLARKDKLKLNKDKFCSNSCGRIYTMKSHMKKKDTSIEIIIRDWLFKNNIDFKLQHFIRFDNGYTLVDFFVKPNICLYCDGDYWHSLPEVQERDIRQNESLSAMGYNVIRLSGTEILNGIRPNLK